MTFLRPLSYVAEEQGLIGAGFKGLRIKGFRVQGMLVNYKALANDSKHLFKHPRRLFKKKSQDSVLRVLQSCVVV